MSLTIESRIYSLICDRIQDGMVSTEALSCAVSSPDAASRSSFSGTYTGSTPRKFLITVDSVTETGGVAHVLETTLWASFTHPASYDENITFTFDTPFQIDTTGISYIIKSTAQANDAWEIRVATASKTVLNVVPHPFDYNDLETPSIAVYSTDDSANPQVQGLTDHELSIVCLVVVEKDTFEAGIGHEIVGDLCDILNRDRALYDNSVCLATDCYVTGHRIFDASISTGKAIFQVDATVKYRTQFNNSRSR